MQPSQSEPTPAHLVLVLGGARSGKSRYAESLITAHPAPWLYLATAEAGDDEMSQRIAQHKSRRSSAWITIEAPLDIPTALRAAPPGPLLLDCLTLWLTNLILRDQPIQAATNALTQALSERGGLAVLVANEVGLGIVPDNALARRFRDAAGLLNQTFAAHADNVVFIAAGLPLRLK